MTAGLDEAWGEVDHPERFHDPRDAVQAAELSPQSGEDGQRRQPGGLFPGLDAAIEAYATGAVNPRPLVAATVGLEQVGSVLAGEGQQIA